MALSDLRRMQRAWSGRIIAIAVVAAFLSVASVSDACALAASSAASTSHCGDCPDQGTGDACSGTALCVFAGTALMKSDLAFVPAVSAASERIEREPSRSASIFLIPPNPPPISG
jgi:hypothetical protein